MPRTRRGPTRKNGATRRLYDETFNRRVVLFESCRAASESASRSDEITKHVEPAAGLFENLRCDVGRRATEGSREGLLSDDLGEAEVGKFHVEVLVDQKNILWLDVAVDNISLVLDDVGQHV